ncbi:MAG: ABC transporter permease [Rhizobiaceae bacterium]|jgi:cell division transport system permease protein|nr:ABC transporter permease [Rhizobiaceae bacterium]
MTEQLLRRLGAEREKAKRQALRPANPQAANPVLPASSVSMRALTLVVAIMTFLACLTAGAVLLVNQTARTWQTQISREATIQIRPAEALDMEAALEQARALAETFPGVTNARIIDRAATARLLEPWLGSGLDIDTLPVPRLVVVTIDTAQPPDFEALGAAVLREVPNASFDSHRTWVDRLIAMARTTAFFGLAIFALMLAATVLTVVFATRGAMAGASHVIEVLHFIGAESRYIARLFRNRFFMIGLWGGFAGGALAVLMFLALHVWGRVNMAAPEADQAAALFGQFALGPTGYALSAVVVLAVAALTALTSQLTVVAYLEDLHEGQL